MNFLQQSYDFDTHVSIQLFHALDANNPNAFTSRGNVSVLSINTGEMAINQREITQNDRKLIAELAKKNKFYRLRAEVVGSDGVKNTFLTSSRAVSHDLNRDLNFPLYFPRIFYRMYSSSAI